MADEKLATRVTLGRVYEDEITGFVGTATTRVQMKNGCVMVGLTPRVGDDGKMLNSWAIYETQLVDKETRERIDSQPSPDVLARLGRHYVDPKTGFAGVAVEYVEHLNGAIQMRLVAPVKKNGTMGQSWSIDESELVDTDAGKKLASTAPRGPSDTPSSPY